jgi:hypothetical protein
MSAPVSKKFFHPIPKKNPDFSLAWDWESR